MTFDAFWLPDIAAPETIPFSSGDTEYPTLRVPVVTPDQLGRQVTALLAARDRALRERPVGDIIRIVDRVASRFLDRGDPLRKHAEGLLPEVTGLTPEMVSLIVDRMAGDWKAERLTRLLELDLGDPRVLDTFAMVNGRRTHAVGPSLCVHIFSGNVPGIGVTSLIRTLLLKSAAIAKTASGEPVLAPLFARALAEEDPELGACLAVLYWPGSEHALTRAAMEKADTVIAYGSAKTLAEIREMVPVRTQLVAYGNRISFAIVTREQLNTALAARAAKDAALAVATFDQQGCVSPQAVFVEEGGEVSPSSWARLLADEMEKVEHVLPRGRVTWGEASAVQQFRGEAEVASLAGEGQVLYVSGKGTDWTVVFDPHTSIGPTCLNRTVRVVPVASTSEVPSRLAHLAELLQTIGFAGPEVRLEAFALEAARLGVSRIAPLSEMAWPPPWWHHDGHPPLAGLLRWCDLD